MTAYTSQVALLQCDRPKSHPVALVDLLRECLQIHTPLQSRCREILQCSPRYCYLVYLMESPTIIYSNV
ncbi:hypothetical protein SK128_013261 [Halocaridina rubra]|uniref:Uncharacterized protein n=1 Tax=Halocaridina rubra TaxID=373956 RepID=A0AAN8XAY0_HALRR